MYLKIPILGICYGLHLLVKNYGGIVENSKYGEYGLADLCIIKDSLLLKNVPSISKVWMSHGDIVTKLPDSWSILANSSNNIVVVVSNENQSIFATQFHPEVVHTKEVERL